jgi:hypothetical protein
LEARKRENSPTSEKSSLTPNACTVKYQSTRDVRSGMTTLYFYLHETGTCHEPCQKHEWKNPCGPKRKQFGHNFRRAQWPFCSIPIRTPFPSCLAGHSQELLVLAFFYAPLIFYSFSHVDLNYSIS